MSTALTAFSFLKIPEFFEETIVLSLGRLYLFLQKSTQILVFFSVCSPFKFFGAILAQTFLLFKILVIICLTVSLSICTYSAAFLMLRRRSFRARVLACHNLVILYCYWTTSLFIFHPSPPPKILYPTDIFPVMKSHEPSVGYLLSPFTSHNKWCISVAIFFSFAVNVM
jgi:hypothetical protein